MLCITKWQRSGRRLESVLVSQKENWQAPQGHYQHDPHRCLLEMLETWLERVDPPTTWATIIEAVEFLGEEQLGKELRENYTVN